jgi:hypothetical protein
MTDSNFRKVARFTKNCLSISSRKARAEQVRAFGQTEANSIETADFPTIWRPSQCRVSTPTPPLRECRQTLFEGNKALGNKADLGPQWRSWAEDRHPGSGNANRPLGAQRRAGLGEAHIGAVSQPLASARSMPARYSSRRRVSRHNPAELINS